MPPSTLGDYEPHSWRERVLQGLIWASFAAFLSVGGWTIARGLYGLEAAKFFGAITVVTLAMAFSKRRLSYRARVAALLSSVGVASIYTLARGGYAPNAFVAFGFIIVAATLLLGVRGGVGATVFFTLSLIVVPTLQRAGVIQRAEGWAVLLDSADLDNIGRVVTNFAVLSSSSVLAVSYLLRRGERLLQERTRSLERLASEQADKERIRADLELREAAFRKASELEILGRLSGSMAHDFNNALLVIFAAIDQFSRAELTPELTEAVEAVRGAATQAVSATRQLRAFGPQIAGAPTHVVLGPALRRLVLLLARVLPSNIELALEVDERLCVWADEGALQRMLTNLVLNARDAMRQGGKVVIRVERATSAGVACARIEVRDNGAGMTEEVRRHLFEPFFTTKEGAGTGLGLASVRALVEAAGGNVSIESEQGVGSAVSAYWPLAEAAPAAAPRPSEALAFDGKGTNVLLVDDDAQVRALLARGLKRLGFTVLEAADGHEGLLVARRHREALHVLCTDCIMPGLPLRELIAGYRLAHPEGRVLVCSGYALDESGIEPGATDAFMSKPFRITELAHCLHELAKRGAETAETTASPLSA